MYFLPSRVRRHHIIHQGSECVIVFIVLGHYRPDYRSIIRIASEGLDIFSLRSLGFLMIWLWYAIKVNLVIVIFPVRPIDIRSISVLAGFATFVNLYNLNRKSIELRPRNHICRYSPQRYLRLIYILKIQALCSCMRVHYRIPTACCGSGCFGYNFLGLDMS